MPTTGRRSRAGADRRVCIFTRAPVLGRVKTRLAARLGPQGALAAHIELLERTLSACRSPEDYRLELWVAGAAENAPDSTGIDELVARCEAQRFEQQGGDLGERMLSAFRHAAEGTPTLLIGSDCPDIDRTYLLAAFERLESADLVLGPAEDGGYGLIGMTSPEASLFDVIDWGSAGVLGATLERAGAAGMSVALLPEIYDVDRPEDWQRYLDGRRQG